MQKSSQERAGSIEYMTVPCQIQNDFINTSCCFQKTFLEGNIVQMWRVLVGGGSSNAVSKTSKIAIGKEISLRPSNLERKPNGVDRMIQ